MHSSSYWKTALLLGAIALVACGEQAQIAGGAGGDGLPSDEGRGAAGTDVAPDSGGDDDLGAEFQEGLDGTWNDGYEVCTLRRCSDGSETGVSCREVFDACVGRGHYARSCRMDADMTCGVFGETGAY